MALNPRRFQRPQRFIKEPEHKINRRIQAPEVRLVGDNVEQGVYPTDVAIKMAEDLVDFSLCALAPARNKVNSKEQRIVFFIFMIVRFKIYLYTGQRCCQFV